MSKLNVAVIYGGCSEEHEVSKISAATIISNMSEEKYNIIPVYITKEGKWLTYEGPSKENTKNIDWDKFGIRTVLSTDRSFKGLLRIVGDKIKLIPLDVVVPVLHGTNGEDGTIQGLFELAALPYVGCGVLASAMAMDKEITKIIAKSVGANQAPYLAFRAEDLEALPEAIKKIRYKIGYPCFVKPANAGSSVGVHKANDKKELESAIEDALQYDKKIIIEKAVVGREVECAVLGDGGKDTQASCVGEILAAADFYDYEAKYNNPESQTIVPATLPEGVQEEIKEMALKIFKALGCKGLSRVDFFLEAETNKVIFNEINTFPGFTSISMYPMLWKAEGLSMEGLIDRLIELGM